MNLWGFGSDRHFSKMKTAHLYMRYVIYFALVASLVGVMWLTFGQQTSSSNQKVQVQEKTEESSLFKATPQTYQWLSQRLADNNLPVDERIYDAVKVIFVNPNERKTATDLATKLLDDPNHRNDMYEFLLRSESNPDILYEFVEEKIDRLWTLADRTNIKRGSYYGWDGSYLLEATIMGYEATEQERFLVLARDVMLEVLSNRDDIHGRVDEYRGRALKAWGTSHLNGGGQFHNVVTHAGRIATPMAWYAWIVRQHPELSKEHTEAAEKLLTAAKEALREFDDEFITVNDGSYGYYWRVTEDRIEPLNHQTSVGQAYLYISELSDTPYWSKRLQQITEFTRRMIYKQGDGTVAWRYNASPDNPSGARPEPIWKGHVTIRFMIQSEQLDAGFNKKDLMAIAKSFRINVLRDGKNLNAMFSEQLDPLQGYSDHRYGGPINLLPYLVLSKYDAELGKMLISQLVNQPDIGGWLSKPKTAISYAYLLRQHSQ